MVGGRVGCEVGSVGWSVGAEVGGLLGGAHERPSPSKPAAHAHEKRPAAGLRSVHSPWSGS